MLEIGFQKYGDDPRAIVAWIGKLHDYQQFWNLVEGQWAVSFRALGEVTSIGG